MEMKYAKFKKDERCRKLERSLKLAKLRKANKELATNASTRRWDSMSSILTDPVESNYTLSCLQSPHAENEVVSSSNNLKNVLLKKNSKYTIQQTIATSSVKQSPIRFIQDKESIKQLYICHSSNKSGTTKANSLINSEAVPCNVKRTLFLSSNDEKSVARNISHELSEKTNVEHKFNRTFFNWKIMLNREGHLLIKGTLESGKIARSKAVLRRLTATTVQSVFLHVYHLKGNIVDNKNELPEYVKGKFYNGFPDDWMNVCQVWKLYIQQGCKPSFRWPTKITDSDDDLRSEITELSSCVKKISNGMRDIKSTNETLQIEPKNMITAQNYKLASSIQQPLDHIHEDLCRNNSSQIKGKSMFTAEKHCYVSADQLNTERNDTKEISEVSQHDDKCIHETYCTQEEITFNQIIQGDKLNIIINNLLQKDCPKEYIKKIVQMFDCINDVFSYNFDEQRTDDTTRLTENHEMSHNSKKSVAVKNCNTAKQYVNDCTQTDIVLPDVCNMSPYKNKNHECVDDLESEIYAGITKIEFEKIIQNRKAIPKRDKHKRKEVLTDLSQAKYKYKETSIESQHGTSYSNGKINGYSPAFSEKENEKKISTKKAQNVNCNKMVNTDNKHNDECKNSDISFTDEEILNIDTMNNRQLSKQKQRSVVEDSSVSTVSSTDDEVKSHKQDSKYPKASKIIKHNHKKQKIVHNTSIISNNYICDKRETNTKSDSTLSSTDDGIPLKRKNENKIICTEQPESNTMEKQLITNFDKTKSNIEVTPKHALVNKLLTSVVGICNERTNLNKHSTSSESPQFPKKAKPIIIDSVLINTEKVPADNINFKIASVRGNNANVYLSTRKDIKETQEPSLELNKLYNNPTSLESDKNHKFGSMNNPKLLFNWTPQVTHIGGPDSELGLQFGGKLLNEAGHIISRKFSTECVLRRLSATLIETVDHEFYQLVGNLSDYNHVVPKELQKQCRDGCPSNISEFCRMWKSFQKDDSNLRNGTLVETLDIPVSKRGRRKFPPLNYWSGERITSKDDKVIYNAGSTEQLSIISVNRQNENMNSIAENTNKSSCKKSGNLENVDVQKKEQGKLKHNMDLKKKQKSVIASDTEVLEQSKANRYNTKQCSPNKRASIKVYYTNVPMRDDSLTDVTNV